MTLRRLLPFVAVLLLAASARADDLAKETATVERIRHLTFTSPVASATVKRSELPDRLRSQLVASMPYSEEEFAQVLKALQLVDARETDLVGKLLDLLQGQVLAYYNPSDRTFYVVDAPPPSVGEALGADLLREGVVVHELTHALQDQRFDIGRRERELRDDMDGALALHALAEGEASFVMLAYILERSGVSIDALVDSNMAGSAMAAMQTATASMGSEFPRYFVESLAYPYVQGMMFVLEAYKRGGWAAVDALWAAPPESTREVSDPSLYFARTAHRTPFAAPAHRAGLLTTEHLGEFNWAYLVGTDAARGWRDDRVTVLQNDFCEPTVLARTEWQSPADAARFRAAYARFLKSRGIEAELQLDGHRVLAGYGADAAAVEQFVWGGASE